MAAEKVVLQFEANMEGLEQALASIPDMTAAEARKAVKELRKNFLASEKAAKQAAKAASKAYRRAGKDMDEAALATKKLKDESGEAASVLGKLKSGVSLLAPELEGAFDAAQKLADGTEGLAQAGVSTTAILGTAGLAAAVGAAAAAFKIMEAQNAAVNASLERTRQTTLELSDGYRQLAVIQGKEVAENAGADLLNSYQAQRIELTALIEENRTFADGASDVLIGLNLMNDAFRELSGRNVELAGLESDLRRVEGAIDDARTSLKKTNDELKSLAGQEELAALLGVPDAGAVAEDPKVAKEREARARKAAEAARKRREEERKATEALHREIDQIVDGFHKQDTDRIKAQGKAREKLAAIASTSARTQMEPEQQLTAAYEDQLAKIDELAQAYPHNLEIQQEATAARLAIETEYYAELKTLRDQNAKEEQDAARERTLTQLSVASQLVDSAHDLASARIESMGDVQAAGKSEAKRMFKIQKALAMVGVALDGAQAVIKAFAQFGPPPSPLGIAAAAAAGIATTASLATIAAQQPEFPMGGIVPSIDHRLIAAQPGEAVLNRAAVDRLGPSGVDALNNGHAAPAQIVITQQYEHRVFDVFVSDNLAEGGPLAAALNKRSGPPGHSRRRR
jgi:hypothetical protein